MDRDVLCCAGDAAASGGPGRRAAACPVEESPSQRERAFEALAEHSPDAIARYDRALRYVYVNAKGTRLAGLPRERILGRTNPDLGIAPELSEGIDASLRRVFATGEGSTLELPFTAVDGEIRWFQARYVAERDAAGEVELVLAVARDITPLKRAEEELRRRTIELDERIDETRRAEEDLRSREALFRTVVENATDVVTILDLNGLVMYESAAVERVLGYRPDQLVGTTPFSRIHPDDAPRIRAAFTIGVADPQSRAQETMRIRHADGSWRTIESTARNLVHNPAVNGIVVVSRDVSERVRAEEERRALEQQLLQSQKMEAIGRLAGGVAHDFNNLLTVIGGHSELLLLSLAENDLRRPDVETIAGAAQRAASLTRQLLAFSRKQVLQPRVLDVNAIVAELQKMLQRLIGEDIELETRLAPEVGRVTADPGQLEQVILNLAVNSRDAMPAGGRLTIETRDVELHGEAALAAAGVAPGPYVAFAVSDTGIGMSAEVRAHAFEPFFTTKPGGTGLGLATVYGIAHQSGGHVTVSSEPGRGTTVTVLLPRSVMPSVEPLGRAAAEMPRGEETVLIVEDERSVRELARTVLTRCGYQVLSAENAAAAVQVAGAHPDRIDLLLTDVVMPGASGRELAETLTARRPELRVLFMTGYTDDAIVRHGLFTGEHELLEKPFNPLSLARKVRAVLDGPLVVAG